MSDIELTYRLIPSSGRNWAGKVVELDEFSDSTVQGPGKAHLSQTSDLSHGEGAFVYSADHLCLQTTGLLLKRLAASQKAIPTRRLQV